MLQVVDQQQHLHLLQVPAKGLHQRPARYVFDPERLGEDRGDEIRGLQRCQGYEGDTVGEIRFGAPCHLQSQPGLADAPGTGQGQKPHVVATQEDRHVLHLVLAPDERRRGHGKCATGKLGSGAASGGRRAAASNSARSEPSSRRASASFCTVYPCGRRRFPRSRRPMAWGVSPVLSARSSWVRLAEARWRRSRSPNWSSVPVCTPPTFSPSAARSMPQ